MFIGTEKYGQDHFCDTLDIFWILRNQRNYAEPKLRTTVKKDNGFSCLFLKHHQVVIVLSQGETKLSEDEKEGLSREVILALLPHPQYPSVPW